MSATRSDVEFILTKRLAGYLGRAEMAVPAGDENEHLTDPIGWALRQLGYSPASLIAIGDVDVAAVAAAHIDALLDLAELRTMESMLTNLDDVSVKGGPVEARWGELRADLLKALPKKRSDVAAMWGHLLATPLDGDAPRSVRLRAI
ncbi:MAG: hypothetical protein DCC55_11360 [Chloroflexi bacterium]|nr:MAG: hypothetical protein DCC55_11360 [Chloroflexota bacterium]